MIMFDLEQFISDKVIKRKCSMFIEDISNNTTILEEKITGRSVLVIGGAGSIGSSYIKALLHFSPSSLTVVDTNENALAELTRDLRCGYDIVVPKEYITYPMDYSSSVFEKMFSSHRGFDIVANFSAHKHVRSEKDIFSIEALIRNNVINAKKLLELLCKYPPESYFCVSTDKAANPVNIMGASKRIMEDMIFSYSNSFPIKTARFANVAFSNGSLPASFLERIQKQQPICAPYDVRRFFVSPEESGQICLLASILGENREIFFPKLSESSMKSFDKIAENLLLEFGYKIKRCESVDEAIKEAKELNTGKMEYPVLFTSSDTSGEKEFEEFFTEEEETDLVRFKSLGVIVNKPIPCINNITHLIDKLEYLFSCNEYYSKEKVIEIINEYMPWFRHIETGKNLDDKM